MEIIGLIIAIIGVIALIPSTRESILGWIQDEKPLIVEGQSEYSSGGFPILNEETKNSRWLESWESQTEYVSGTRGSISLYVKNQNSKSELALSLAMPIKLLEYKIPIDDYYVDVLLTEPGGMGGGVVKEQYFFALLDTSTASENYAHYCSREDLAAIYNSGVAPTGKSTEIGESEYYYLDPGDVEIFTISLNFSAPGDYKFQVGVDMYTDKGEISRIWVDQVFEVSIAKGLNLWSFGSTSFRSLPHKIEEFASCTFTESKLNNRTFLEDYSCSAPVVNTGMGSKINNWPTGICNLYPPSRLEIGKRAHICVDKAQKIFDSPNTQLESHLSFYKGFDFTVVGGPVCDEFGSPWWRVLSDSGYGGWMLEVGGASGEYLLCPGGIEVNN